MSQLLKMQNKFSVRCVNKKCQKVFVDRGKLLQHNMNCSNAISCKMWGEKCVDYNPCRDKQLKVSPKGIYIIF